ncbi:hypothetical protein C8R43DRAFT_1124928 [Mycena crocata]|nr:hypothetical protein C8R43DRAFT_1124928 [Mycena crocata]
MPSIGSSDVLVGFRAFPVHRTPTFQAALLNLCGAISRGSGISAHCKSVEYTPYRRPASGTKISKNPPEANTLHHLQFDVFSHLLLESCPKKANANALPSSCRVQPPAIICTRILRPVELPRSGGGVDHTTYRRPEHDQKKPPEANAPPHLQGGRRVQAGPA